VTETDDHEALAPEVEALVLAELAKRVAASRKTVDATVGQTYPAGRKETFRSPGGTKLGICYRTDPDPMWIVTDSAALHDALDTPDSDAWETVGVLILPSGEDVRMQLDDELFLLAQEHAPHLTSTMRVLRESVVGDLIAESRRTGKPAAPGIERVKPRGVFTVKPDRAAAGAAIEEMLAAGLITWDGRPALTSAEQVAS
jgi:hypothetical protein